MKAWAVPTWLCGIIAAGCVFGAPPIREVLTAIATAMSILRGKRESGAKRGLVTRRVFLSTMEAGLGMLANINYQEEGEVMRYSIFTDTPAKAILGSKKTLRIVNGIYYPTASLTSKDWASGCAEV